MKKKSIINPDLDKILTKVPNTFYAINMVAKRSKHFFLEGNERPEFITHARLTTFILEEMVNGKISYEANHTYKDEIDSY